MDLQLLLSKIEHVSKSELLKSNNSPLEVLQFIVNKSHFVPNVTIALIIGTLESITGCKLPSIQ